MMYAVSYALMFNKVLKVKEASRRLKKINKVQQFQKILEDSRRFKQVSEGLKKVQE